MKKLFTFISLSLLLLLAVSPVSAEVYTEDQYKEALNTIWVEQYIDQYPYVVLLYRDGSTSSTKSVRMIMAAQEPYVNADTGNLSVTDYYEGTIYMPSSTTYKLSNDKSSTGSISYGIGEGTTYQYSYYYSSVDLYDTNDQLVYAYDPSFFRITPLLDRVVAEEVTNLLKTTVGSMALLTTCGIGLMSLMVSLLVLRRVFRMLSV